MKTYVVIPYKNMAEMTLRLVDELVAQGEFDEMLLFDNGSDSSETGLVCRNT